jgi:hypothetical protein
MIKKRKYHSYLLWAVILFSVIGLFFSPKDQLIEQLKNTLPWVSIGILLSEITLTTGFLLMLAIAAPAFIKSLGKSFQNALEGIFQVKKVVGEMDWVSVAKKCDSSKLFWFGFWVSVVGACGDGVILIIAIGKTLPIQSWGIMILPFWDLGLTYIIRRAIYSGVRKSS